VGYSPARETARHDQLLDRQSRYAYAMIKTAEELVEARVSVLQNAEDLIADAELLLAHNRASRAYALAHLALEEVAKLVMLGRPALSAAAQRQVDWKQLNKRLRSHKAKVDVIHALDYMISDVRVDASDYAEYEQRIRETDALLRTKNRAIYSDELDGRYRRPNEVISPDLRS
jgi:AbiV family abortive infection protein